MERFSCGLRKGSEKETLLKSGDSGFKTARENTPSTLDYTQMVLLQRVCVKAHHRVSFAVKKSLSIVRNTRGAPLGADAWCSFSSYLKDHESFELID